jgi:hypothetical protein
MLGFAKSRAWKNWPNPMVKRIHDENLEWKLTVYGAANHAAVLAFLIRYGNPRIDEPLSRACERCAYSAAWKDCCDEFKSLRHGGPNIWAFSRLVRLNLTIGIVSKLSVRRFDTYNFYVFRR